MKLRLQRIKANRRKTIGRLEVLKDGEWAYLCDTIEPLSYKPNWKLYGAHPNRAVKARTYRITMRVKSPLYSDYKLYPFARQFKGYMPRVIGAEEVCIIKPGKFTITGSDIMVGQLSDDETLYRGEEIFVALMQQYFKPAHRKKEEITIKICAPTHS